MSVIFENELGWLVCSDKAIKTNYQNCQTTEELKELTTTKEDNNVIKENCRSYSFKESLFKIDSPFMMDTQFAKVSAAGIKVEESKKSYSNNPNPEQSISSKEKKKKRKRSELNEGELKALEYHNEVKEIISLAHQSLVSGAADLKYFKTTNISQLDNNCEARIAGMIEGPGNCWALSCDDEPHTEIAEQGVLNIVHKDSFSDCSSLVKRNVRFRGENAGLVKVGSHTYLIPANSSFLMSSLKQLQAYPSFTDGPFDLIVMDPPWQNKSVKRQKSYWSITNEDFLSCPIESLAAPGCLVVVWLTNRQSHQRFVKENLFPKWNVEFQARWHWLKVTTSGECVYDLDSLHKKPYEALFLGRYKSKVIHSLVTEKQLDTNNENTNHLPQDKVIISVPCSLHSKKPNLEEILLPYLIGKPKCLELFARNLWKGWTSWGNEVLKHQHIDYFESIEREDTSTISHTET